MTEPLIERVTDYTGVKVGLASPEEIRGWSYGEVKKPETINYRTYRAEKDGLFCERIFGPERDWECFCGKYKGIKHKGIICDRCGVKITHSRVRRQRMGHISLAAPVVHIWFFRSIPSPLAVLLDMKAAQLIRVIYFQDYVVIDPGKSALKPRQLLSEEEYRSAVDKYGEQSFRAGMGAEAVQTLLRQLDLPKEAGALREELASTKSRQRTSEIIKRLRLVEAVRDSGNRPAWMVLEVIPVIPPDLRPLVLLESGNFATSDLNDLYRRIINRNNRLKKLLDLNAPEVIIRNEKRMLQQSVDALFDNARCKRSVLGSSNRPLKSLTDMIKGKQGRFRDNLLGKRVDYSGRSVIVVGPELKLHQCGLPKKIALELFQPFIIRRLREMGLADTIKSAKRMLERKDEEVWDILEEVIRDHPVLLNRAPTLHRMGIQAFEPILVEGNAIVVPPLVCESYNADFDGDTMAVHLPLSVEAKVEAKVLMLSKNNIFSPANGQAIIRPSLDMILGCYYISVSMPDQPGSGKIFGSRDEVKLAHELGKVALHAEIKVRMPPGLEIRTLSGLHRLEGNLLETTPGRVLFNEILPEGMPFYNMTLNDDAVDEIVSECRKRMDLEATVALLDRIKELGFKESTLAGLSISVDDLRSPPNKEKLIEKAQAEVDRIQRNYERGLITDGERYNQVIDAWIHATDQISEETMRVIRADTQDGKPYLNPVAAMEQSGARGSALQIRQMAGIRGLMTRPSGKIIETPIKASFREGLHVHEYFGSTHGARKGSADTAIKTGEAGYLTRKMADVAQTVVITELDCGTLNGITKGTVYKGEKTEVPLREMIVGRVCRKTVTSYVTDEVIVKENEMVTEEAARRIEELGLDKIQVRSPLTCEARLGLCAKCYGMDLSTGREVELGTAVGIIGAQSIGERGTQLTMRTFHIGGTASRAIEESEIRARTAGAVRFERIHTVKGPEGGLIVLKPNGQIVILDAKERELETYPVPLGANLLVEDGEKVAAQKLLAKWDPHMTPVLADISGRVRFESIEEGKTMRTEIDSATGIRRRIIVDFKGDVHPQILIENDRGEVEAVFPIPEKAHIEVDKGEKVAAGTLLAKMPRETTGTQDITGGLPRVTELFEARKPKEPAIISEIDGVVELGEKRRGKRMIVVRNEETGLEREHLVPHGKHLRVHRGDRVSAGDQLVDGPLVPHDILRISGEEAVQQYLLRQIQSVYRTFGAEIDDKHVEVIVSRMTRKVQVEDPGDTCFLPGSLVDKIAFRDENRRVAEEGGKGAKARPVLLGITKAALGSESFLSAASFQDTTKVFTEAALAGKLDRLEGLKENLILGHLIPAGTGFRTYRDAQLKTLAPEGEEGSKLPELEAEVSAAAS